MAAVHLCTYSSLVPPCNLKCLPPPLCGTEPVTTSCVVDKASSWFQADLHVYPRPSNTWHHGTTSHTESWSTDQVSLSHVITGLSATVCQLIAVGFVKLPSSCFLYTFHVAWSLPQYLARLWIKVQTLCSTHWPHTYIHTYIQYGDHLSYNMHVIFSTF